MARATAARYRVLSIEARSGLLFIGSVYALSTTEHLHRLAVAERVLSPRPAHSGAGARNVTGSRLTGCRNVISNACRHNGGASTLRVCTSPSSLPAKISGIATDRPAEMRGVNSNLVGAAGTRARLEQAPCHRQIGAERGTPCVTAIHRPDRRCVNRACLVRY